MRIRHAKEWPLIVFFQENLKVLQAKRNCITHGRLRGPYLSEGTFVREEGAAV
jgi:hypothetical protein